MKRVFDSPPPSSSLIEESTISQKDIINVDKNYITNNYSDTGNNYDSNISNYIAIAIFSYKIFTLISSK